VQHGLSIVLVLSFGALATEIGTRADYIMAPALGGAVVVWLIRRSYRVADEPVPGRYDVLSSFWEESETVPPVPPTPARRGRRR
jgi:hypothetical protein